MPPIFLNKNINKMDQIEFSILAYYDIRLRVDILIYSGLFSNYIPMFIDTASVRIVEPSRGFFGTPMVHGILLNDEMGVNVPINLPNFNQNYDVYPTYSMSFAS